MPAGGHLDASRPGASRPPLHSAPWLERAPLPMLVADENAGARDTLAHVVSPGVDVTLCTDGAEALWHAGRADPVVVILSATLPVVSAAEVASVLARHGGGRRVLVSVAVGEAEQARPVLAAGATGVVSRPYRAAEIQPLLRTHLAHQEKHQQQAAVIAAGDLVLDGRAFEARAAGRPLRLTLREFQLLRLLMLHAGDVVSADRIRQEIWVVKGETVTPNTIAVHVRHLRKHVAGTADIVTIRGVGYRLEAVGSQAGGTGSRVDLLDTGS